MVPMMRKNQSWLPDIFNDFFDTEWMEKTNATAPAINVPQFVAYCPEKLAIPIGSVQFS